MGLYQQEKIISTKYNPDEYRAVIPNIFDYYLKQSKETVIDRITTRDIENYHEEQRQEKLKKEKE